MNYHFKAALALLLLIDAGVAPSAKAQIVSLRNAAGLATMDSGAILNGIDSLTIPVSSSTPNSQVINGTTLIFNDNLASNAQLNTRRVPLPAAVWLLLGGVGGLGLFARRRLAAADDEPSETGS